LASKSSLVLVDDEEFLDFPRPILHKVLYIGGLGVFAHQNNGSNVLERKWSNIVENSKDGVVLFSFGSVANTELMPLLWKVNFLSLLSVFQKYFYSGFNSQSICSISHL